MKKVSTKQASLNREVAKIKASLPERCEICGCNTIGDAAHLLPKSKYPEYYTDARNIVRLCRDCHRQYDDDLLFRRKQQKLIDRVAEIDRLAAVRHFKLYTL